MHSSETCTLPFSLTQQPATSFPSITRKMILGAAEVLCGMTACNTIYQQISDDGTMVSFVRQALKTLDINYTVDELAITGIPTSGPCVLIANHPYGGVEGLILFDLIARIRTDFKVMGNHLLGRLPALHSHLITVDPFAGKNSARENIVPLRHALKSLINGELLIIFPAGEVSYRVSKKAGIVDPSWSDSVARIIRRSKAPVVPICFPGHNGPLFQWAGKIHPRLRTALLPRMLLKQRHQCKQVIIGQLIPPRNCNKLTDDHELINYLRLRTYALEGKASAYEKSVSSALASPMPVIGSPDTHMLQNEISALPTHQRLVENNEFQVACATTSQIPWLLNEIGRQRELTFRQISEGTGKSCDLDQFDENYTHLFLWHKDRQEIAGAYRIGHIDHILKTSGRNGLYTNTLFSMKPNLLAQLHNGLELGRSFVRPEYQRSFAPLYMLWKGIGRYLTLHPHYRYLLGPVSISREYSLSSQQLITTTLTEHYRINELASLVRPRTPVTFKTTLLAGLDLKQQAFLKEIDNLSVLVSDMEADGKGIPVLLRHYLNLGGQILAFNRDPLFGDVIDGLLLVDLLKTDKKHLQRYMEKDAYAQYMAHHTPARTHR